MFAPSKIKTAHSRLKMMVEIKASGIQNEWSVLGLKNLIMYLQVSINYRLLTRASHLGQLSSWHLQDGLHLIGQVLSIEPLVKKQIDGHSFFDHTPSQYTANLARARAEAIASPRQSQAIQRTVLLEPNPSQQIAYSHPDFEKKLAERGSRPTGKEMKAHTPSSRS